MKHIKSTKSQNTLYLANLRFWKSNYTFEDIYPVRVVETKILSFDNKQDLVEYLKVNRDPLDWTYSYVIRHQGANTTRLTVYELLMGKKRPKYFRQSGTQRSRHSYSVWLKRPQRHNAARLASYALDEDYEHLVKPVRAKRMPNNLPNPWDDFYRVVERNWKKFRKTQYKESNGK